MCLEAQIASLIQTMSLDVPIQAGAYECGNAFQSVYTMHDGNAVISLHYALGFTVL